MAAWGPTAGWMTYGHLRADCLYTGISSGPNARYRVWEAFISLHFCFYLPGHCYPATTVIIYTCVTDITQDLAKLFFFLSLCQWQTLKKPVPETGIRNWNQFLVPKRTCSIRYQHLVPDKIDARLHVIHTTNRYQFFWYRFLVKFLERLSLAL